MKFDFFSRAIAFLAISGPAMSVLARCPATGMQVDAIGGLWDAQCLRDNQNITTSPEGLTFVRIRDERKYGPCQRDEGTNVDFDDKGHCWTGPKGEIFTILYCCPPVLE